MKPQYDQIPEELRSLSNWIVWRREKRANKSGVVQPTKVPYNARSHKHAKSNDPGTWSTFGDALAAVDRYDGVGFCLVEPYIGADLDGCRVNGIDEPWAAEIINELDSYTELSPSASGIRVLVKGSLPDGPRQKDLGGEHHGVGLYDSARGRYLTMTGCRVNGNGTIAERTAELARIHARLFPPKSKSVQEVPHTTASLSDDDLIERARKAGDGGKFSRLWDGQWKSDYGSQSEADLALCMKLAFWTGRDAGRIDALFRRSGLMRDKWNRQDYREATIARAIAQTDETWQPKRLSVPEPEQPSAGSAAGEGTAAEAKPEIADSELLEGTEKFIRRYVVLPENVYLPAALWAIATHAVQEFECFPYIAVVSATKQSGKTRFAEVLETVVRKPWRGTAPSPAAVYRYLEDAPTLLLDETEPLNGKNKSEMTTILLSVLNVGYRKGASVLKCDGTEHKPRKFPVYGPKLFAGIGRLPDTLMDRSIVVHMKRRTKAQKIGRFLLARVNQEVKPLAGSIVRFVRRHRSLIEGAYQVVVDQDLDYLRDRDAEMWMPLFALCAVLDSSRLGELRKCAEVLSGSKSEDDEDDSYALGLLKDIREVWPGENGLFAESDKSDKCETAVLIEKLKALEESPWGEHQLNPRKLARMLRPFDVLPRQIWINERNAKGYLWVSFKDAFDRYLDEKKARSAETQ